MLIIVSIKLSIIHFSSSSAKLYLNLCSIFSLYKAYPIFFCWQTFCNDSKDITEINNYFLPFKILQVTCALFTCGDKNIELPPWLQGIDLLQINMAKLSSMAALCMLWGLISMLPSEIMVLEVDSQDETPLFEVILKKLLELDERCVSMSTQAQAVKTVTLWTTRM